MALNSFTTPASLPHDTGTCVTLCSSGLLHRYGLSLTPAMQSQPSLSHTCQPVPGGGGGGGDSAGPRARSIHSEGRLTVCPQTLTVVSTGNKGSSRKRQHTDNAPAAVAPVPWRLLTQQNAAVQRRFMQQTRPNAAVFICGRSRQLYVKLAVGGAVPDRLPSDLDLRRGWW